MSAYIEDAPLSHAHWSPAVEPSHTAPAAETPRHTRNQIVPSGNPAGPARHGAVEARDWLFAGYADAPGPLSRGAQLDLRRDGGSGLNDAAAASGALLEADGRKDVDHFVAARKWEQILLGLLQGASRPQHERIIETFRDRARASREITDTEMASAITMAVRLAKPGWWHRAVEYNDAHAGLVQKFGALAGLEVDRLDPETVTDWKERFNARVEELVRDYGLHAHPIAVDGRVGPETLRAAELLSEAGKRSNRPKV